MEEGTVLKWLVEVGGQVKRGEPLVEIETDKANMTHDADADGVLVEVLAQEGETLAVGEAIARIGAEGEAPSGGGADAGGSGEAEDEPSAEQEAEPGTGGGEAEPGAGVGEPSRERERRPEAAEPDPDVRPTRDAASGAGRLKASPVARRMAEEKGVDLGSLEGSGPGGRIVKADVEAAEGGRQKPEAAGDGGGEGEQAEAPEAEEAAAAGVQPKTAPASGEGGPKGEPEVQELTRLQRTVSRRMAESKATAPDFALSLDVDMTLCIELRERLKEQTENAPSFNDMVVKAAALALRDHPRVNSAYRDAKFELYPRVNVGVAVAAQGTLVVPVVRDADEKSLGEISRQARRLIGRVRDGEITPPELSGGTFTVSNLGMYGIESFTAIINPPQAAILTVGALAKKAVVDDNGRVVARDMMNLTLVCDHRILYGADGAEFLAAVRKLVEAPLSLAL